MTHVATSTTCPICGKIVLYFDNSGFKVECEHVSRKDGKLLYKYRAQFEKE